MVITRTPFRVSLLGGGSDYPTIFRRQGGATLVGAINRYCYTLVRAFPPFFAHTDRAVWSQIENVTSIDEIKNPVIRECRRFIKDERLEVNHWADLPARSGMGSSSAFTVGLLHALHEYKGMSPNRRRLAREAIHVERDMIGDEVGIQDQIACAHGGLNLVMMAPDGTVEIRNCAGGFDDCGDERMGALASRLRLFFTGISRISTEVSSLQMAEVLGKESLYRRLMELAIEGAQVIDDPARDLGEFEELLNEAWAVKRQLSGGISTPEIDSMADKLMARGVKALKLLGAGGGGFFLLYAEDDFVQMIEAIIKREFPEGSVLVPFGFDSVGSTVVFRG